MNSSHFSRSMTTPARRVCRSSSIGTSLVMSKRPDVVAETPNVRPATLDEPTSRLAIEGQDMLESELVEHGAACLLVSHDRAFVRAVATRIWVITGKRLIVVDDPDRVFDQLMSG
jgi:ABC-type glutathione transport system ATPase component